MQGKKRKNIALADTLVGDEWEFANGLREATCEPWVVKCWSNAELKKNKLFNIKRFAGYFIHPFEIFINRKQYKSIVAWQQFYGLIFAFYCSLFHVKKENNLVIMTFIYKDKSGLTGKLYKAFISKIMKSRYVDKFVVFSEHEIAYYSHLFGISKDKFCFFLLGIEDRKFLGKTTRKLEKPFLLAAGRSNRDFPFLFRSVENLPYHVVVLSDSVGTNEKIPENVTILNDIHGEEYLKVLEECVAVLIPLKVPDISAGQLVMLQAMQYEKPIVVTETTTIKHYVENSVNAIICRKNEEEFRNAILQLMKNTELQNILRKNGKAIFDRKFSLKTLGKHIGDLFVGYKE